MNYHKPMTQLIRNRISVRTYDPKPIPEDRLKAIRLFLEDLNATAVSKIRFALLTRSEKSENMKLGTYGIISGTHTYLVGLTDLEKGNAMELGYLFEKVVLKATELDLGTVWLGGTFNRGDFEKNLAMNPNETIAIVSPIGIPKSNRSLIDSAFRLGAGSNNRKPWETLFFFNDPSHPLNKEEAGAYAEVLDMVRLGPSASNKQPWRIVKTGNDFHIFLERTPGYASIMKYDLQLNDIGIAQCHFEMTCQELGLYGSWQSVEPKPSIENWVYCLTWKAKPSSGNL